MICQHDSGSATGNRPLCDAPATITIHVAPSGGYPAWELSVCARHLSATEGALFPYRFTTSPIPSTRRTA